MATLYVASGGGGDAIASAIVHRAVSAVGGEAMIATYAWDRLLVDPLPGPRGVEDFVGLRARGGRTFQVTGETVPVAPAGSTLPRLAAELPVPLLLLDPYFGAAGMAEQIADMVVLAGAERVRIVDVGGDILARGDEQTLRSPLADALAVAACVGLEVPVEVLVLGLGLDAELTPEYALGRLGKDSASRVSVGPEHVLGLDRIFAWHPSEATGMLAAAAKGVRGRVEVRDAGTAVKLSDETTMVFQITLDRLLAVSPLVQQMIGTGSLVEVEDAVRRICGFCEIDYEREKAARLGRERSPALPWDGFVTRLRDFEAGVRDRGSDYVTFRRVAEQVGRPQGGYEEMRRRMIEEWPEQSAGPIWSVRPS
ncbi:DUF1152 domain-containing protein [Actinocorallia lasiicapitis]